jgi:hypothetical protein
MLAGLWSVAQALKRDAAIEHHVFGVIYRAHGALPHEQDEAITIRKDLISI